MRILRSFSWRGFLIFLGFSAGFAALSWSGVLLTNKPLDWAEESTYFLSLFQRTLLNYSPAYVLVTLADGLNLQGIRGRVALAGALFIGIALAVQVRCAVNPNLMFYAYEHVMLRYCTEFPTWRTYLDFPAASLQPFTVAGMVMIFIFTRRRDTMLVARLHGVQASELEERRQRIESEIEAMQARVDPDGLRATLRAVRERYEASAAEGEAMLDRLITDLRHAARHPLADVAPTGDD